MTGSFLGGVHVSGDSRGELRARVALVGSSVEALTGDETFRIPLTRCEVASQGPKIVVRDLEHTMVIWSDEDQFLDALERTRSNALKVQVERVRSRRFRRQLLRRGGKAIFTVVAIAAMVLSLTRWAVGGGIMAITDHIGQSAFHELHLPVGETPVVERHLDSIASQLKPVSSLGKHDFRVWLADYGDVHIFHLPPNNIVVPATLVCNVDDRNLVIAAVALELAHLEARDVNVQTQQLVDWQTSLDVLLGDTKKLRDFMLDYADSKRTPGYTKAQESAAQERATNILEQIGLPFEAGQDVATLLARLDEIPNKRKDGERLQPKSVNDEAWKQWLEVQAKACEVVGKE